MANKALITWRGARTPVSLAREAAAADELGVAIETTMPTGTLISGSDEQYHALEQRGYRVKIFPDTNLLRIGRYTIDTETGQPAVPLGLEVAADAMAEWPHHLVQLVGPPTDEWVHAIEERGIDVVEPISGYGLFVYGTSAGVAALHDLPFVAWTGPLKPAYRVLPAAEAKPEYLFVGIYPGAEGAAARSQVEAAGGTVLESGRHPATYGGEYATLKVQGMAADEIAKIPFVRWVEEVPKMVGTGEREAQIVAENLDATPAPNTSPVTGYQAWLTALGLSGSGVRVAIVDSGVDANADNNNPVAHTDLRGRQVAFVDYSAGAGTTDTSGHGTNVAGIALGSGATGQTDSAAPANFLWGQGIAPSASYVTQNFLDANVSPQPAVQTLIQDAATNLARVMNNSWGVDNSGGIGYGANSRVIDLGVRDPNPAAAGLEHLAIVCAAGNAGGRPQSIGSPHETKNDIVVGNSLTARPGVRFPSEDIRGISGTSSRGPAVDGRILPTVVAPGTDVSAAFSRTATGAVPIAGTGVADPAHPGQLMDQYTFMSGTSQASPQVAGSCALLTEWWRNRTGGKDPSPAMLKALLVNGAEDLGGGANWRCLNRVPVDKGAWSLQSGSVYKRNVAFVPTAVVDGNTMMTQVAAAANITAAGQWAFDAPTNTLFVRSFASANPGSPGTSFVTALDSTPVGRVPSNDQGWGRVSLSNILLQSPSSDRGPKLFSDQRHAFTAAGMEHQVNVAPTDAARPLRVTLTWTDAAGAAGANPALVNDLDLEVTELGTGHVFKGNVFSNGFSTTGGAFDNRNTVECVFIEHPAGTYEVRVIASVIAASANPTIVTPWQDFALVIDNADVAASSPVNVAAVLDRSGSMIAYGYVDVTRTSSKQFVDLMNISDDLGIASFGSNALVEFPSGGTLVQDISAQPVKDTAKGEIDGIAFGGCTFMGEGIQFGASLLSASAAPRALVLLSDGYDNKGCDMANPAKPSALQAASALPADIRIFSCAMGSASDQGLLDSLATATGGRYYFMPTADDLFEIYNYIRGQVSGDAITVNESATASASSTAAFVDATAQAATFTIAWANANVHAVDGAARKPNEVSVRLRDPAGKLLPLRSSYVRRQVGAGYVIYRIEEPMAGQWHIEVGTAEGTHLRYTAGVFLKSPLKLALARAPLRARLGDPIVIGAQMLDGKQPFTNFPAVSTVSAPVVSLKDAIEKNRRRLEQIEPPKLPGGDSLPPDIARLMALQQKLQGKEDLLPRKGSSLRLAALRGKMPPGVALDPSVTPMAGTFAATGKGGSYNFAVTASGIVPSSGKRFVRKDLMSVYVR